MHHFPVGLLYEFKCLVSKLLHPTGLRICVSHHVRVDENYRKRVAIGLTWEEDGVQHMKGVELPAGTFLDVHMAKRVAASVLKYYVVSVTSP